MKKIMFFLLILFLSAACEKKETSEFDDYAKTIFRTSFVHRVDVKISEEDYADLLKNPTDKTQYTVDVTIDDDLYKEVSLSTKGNSSLYFVADDPNSDRYSYKINFSKNRKDQTCHGLDKLNLNNMFEDATCMKDFMSYDMFRYAGVDTPLLAYCFITINGVDHGLYVMVEDIDTSFLIRYHKNDGFLYKPQADLDLNIEDVAKIEAEGLNFDVETNGADFKYIDDDPESYSDIFDNNITKTNEEAEKRIIESIKALNEGKDLEKYLDTDELIRYFAVQSALMNYDGYIGPMLHNYFLYERGGRLALFPWDFNASFMTFTHIWPKDIEEDPTPYVNFGIDTPLYLTKAEERPMWKWIEENEDYRQKYHEAMSEILDTFFTSGHFEKKVDQLYQMLRPYVAKDPSAFYTVEEFDQACKALKMFGKLRYESIQKQLNGNLSTYNDLQDPKEWIDASSLRLGDMQ
ncbi:MAG: CotH kinase family protein [Erysipelotrichaceae bacterium]|nr:CotH kinase family protein [Erysipelotrichaceae bacterium]